MTYNVFSGTLNPTHFTSLPTSMSPDEFLVAVGASIVVRSGSDGRIGVKTPFNG